MFVRKVRASRSVSNLHRLVERGVLLEARPPAEDRVAADSGEKITLFKSRCRAAPGRPGEELAQWNFGAGASHRLGASLVNRARTGPQDCPWKHIGRGWRFLHGTWLKAVLGRLNASLRGSMSAGCATP